MTDNDLKIRARLAYGNTGFTKQAFRNRPYMGSNPTERAMAEGMQAESDYRQAQNKIKDVESAEAEKKTKAEQDAAYEKGRRQKLMETGNGGNLTDAENKQLAQDLMDQGKEKAWMDDQIAGAQASADAKRHNLYYGIGSGALGGAAVGGISYALGGLFPSLRKRRLLRALLALGVGTGAGVGIGYGVNAGLNSGKLQAALGSAKDGALGAWDATKSGVANAIGKIKS